MVRDALLIVAAGTVAALPAVLALRRLVETQLFDVTVFDGPTMAITTAGLALIALAASTLARLADGSNAVLRVE